MSVTTPTWIGPPQTLDQALDDLGRPPLLRKPLAVFSPFRPYDGVPARTPNRAGWAALGAIESLYSAFGAGMVVLGMARA
jgi:hypothetical protein